MFTIKETMDNRVYRATMIMGALDASTREAYRSRADRILREEGGLGYGEVLSFVRKHNSLANSTLRGYKSAVMFLHRLRGPGVGISETESADLDRVLDGHEVISRRTQPRKPRGAVDDDKLDHLVKFLSDQGHEDLAEACIVASGCALRSQDIEQISAEDVDLAAGVVIALRKDSSLRKVRKGDTDERPIATAEAKKVLSRRVKKFPRGNLWPNWNRTLISGLVKQAAERFGWPKNLRWDGLHSVGRHSAAVRARAKALEEVRRVGAWRSNSAAQHYSRSRRT